MTTSRTKPTGAADRMARVLDSIDPDYSDRHGHARRIVANVERLEAKRAARHRRSYRRGVTA